MKGANTVNVVVTTEDGKTTKTYTINIERKASEETAENPERKHGRDINRRTRTIWTKRIKNRRNRNNTRI